MTSRPGGRSAAVRRFALIGIAAAFLGTVPGGEVEAAWRQDRFLIGGWVPGPTRAPARLLQLDDLGLDYFHVDYPGVDECRVITARLDSLAAAIPGFDLQAIVHYRVPFDDPSRITDNDDPAGNWDRILPGLLPAGGMNRRSTLGWHLLDEPSDRAAIARLGEMSRRLRSLPATAGQLGYANLFPMFDPAANGAYARDFGTDPARAYAAYLRAYLAEFDPTGEPASVLSFDHYPFQESVRPGKYWFPGLAIARDAALESSRPPENEIVALWVIVQGTNFRPRGGSMGRHFTPAMLRWQAWSAVAYGAKGIAYWTLSPAEDHGAKIGFGPGVFDAEGRPTALFASVRQLNAELHALGPRLMELDPIGAWHAAADGQSGVPDGRWDVPAAADGALAGVRGLATASGSRDGLVTAFRHRSTGETWVMVVNKSLATSRTFTVQLTRPAGGIERIRRSDGKAVPVAAAGAAFSSGALPAGTGELFRLLP